MFFFLESQIFQIGYITLLRMSNDPKLDPSSSYDYIKGLSLKVCIIFSGGHKQT